MTTPSIRVIKVLLNFGAWLAVLWVFTRFQLPVNSLFYNALQNSGHGIVFFMLTIFALTSLAFRFRRVVPLSLVVAANLFMLGTAIEFVQYLSGRGASFSDLVMNGSGIVSGAILFHLFKVELRWPVQLMLSVIAIGSIAWAIHKPAMYAFAELTEKPLPTLYDFDTMGSGIKLLPRNTEIIIGDHSSVWSTNQSESLEVVFKPGTWPSIVFQEPPINWCDYDTFLFDVYSPLPEAVRLNVRVDDDSINYPDHSFMTIRRMIEPGEEQVIVHFAELVDDASNRGTPTFQEMSSFQLFIASNQKQKMLYFDNFQLKKSRPDVHSHCLL